MKDPVESFSRPVTNAESWALYYFEMHARKCAYCRDPYEVHRNHDQLCEHGHRLAQDVASYIYNKDGKAFSRKDEETKIVQVEIPAGFIQVSGLLRAIERSLRHRTRRAFVSMDRHYQVAPRQSATLPVRHHSVKVEQDRPKTKSSRPRSGEVVDWPDKVEINNSSSRRGSLYEEDLKKRRSANYNVEVREPSTRDLREHRLSGYYR